jgi:hypothetical protein
MFVGASSHDSFPPGQRGASKGSREDTSFEAFGKTHLARANSPVIYARADTIDKFSDIPLLTYYEMFDEPDGVTRIRYSVIFTNEDGGTQSKALMARWGRMTDIEWMYEMRVDKNGKILDETYQAANHVTKPFKGERIFGSHPVMYDATDNNNFSDTGCSQLRLAIEAVEADLSHGSRETLMERFPWIYRVMSEEALREGRIVPSDAGPNTIDDPREYLYAEIYDEPESAAVAFGILTTDGRKFSSDLGSESMRVNRPGHFRIALHLTKDIGDKSIKSFEILCSPIDPTKKGECRNLKLLKTVRLDENFIPIEHNFDFPALTVKSGEAAVFAK